MTVYAIKYHITCWTLENTKPASVRPCGPAPFRIRPIPGTLNTGSISGMRFLCHATSKADGLGNTNCNLNDTPPFAQNQGVVIISSK